MINIKQRIIAWLLVLCTLFSCGIVAGAETISDGKSKTVTITMDEMFKYMQTTNGNSLNGEAWTYTTNTGIQGPAYCINWGLKNPASDKKLTIAGKYTASPKTIGAFANGYPQKSLEDFKDVNRALFPLVDGLNREEYACATQLAVWATLGQLAVEGTDFKEGRATLARQYGDAKKQRTFNAIEAILYNASFWDRPLEKSLNIRLGRLQHGNILDIENDNGLIGAEQDGGYDIQKETIGGIEHYTRTFVAASGTSTFKNDYYIDLWLENAPEGTIFTDLNNVRLETKEQGEKTLWRVPTVENENCTMNDNGTEYAGDFKICIPIRNTPESARVIIHASSIITQYDIYLANNTEENEQSFIIADPQYAPMQTTGEMVWDKVTSPYGRVVVNKIDGMGNPLAGAIFKLVGVDQSEFEGTSNSQGRIVWEYVNPDVQYTLTEVQPPEGFLVAEPMTFSVPAGQTHMVSIRNLSECTVRIKKIDTQNGNPLIGATFRMEQTDGSYKTDLTTGHSGVIELKGSSLPFGSYKVYEIKAPNGYEKDEEVKTFH